MKSTELRIGNLIYDDLGRISKVSNLSKTVIETTIDNFGPSWTTVFRPMGIEINDDFLNRLGFQVEFTNGGFLRWQKGDFKLLDRRLPYPQYHSPGAIIMYVHELQNLYFALTSTELTSEDIINTKKRVTKSCKDDFRKKDGPCRYPIGSCDDCKNIY